MTGDPELPAVDGMPLEAPLDERRKAPIWLVRQTTPSCPTATRSVPQVVLNPYYRVAATLGDVEDLGQRRPSTHSTGSGDLDIGALANGSRPRTVSGWKVPHCANHDPTTDVPLDRAQGRRKRSPYSRSATPGVVFT